MTLAAHPLVSIIVPIYNVERYLDECLNSIRNQTYGKLEIIVVEDCSTDDSSAKLNAHLTDPRVRVIQHERNSGLSAARNTGIEAAKGEFVLFVDSDDAIAPGLVEACLAQATETGADMVVFDFVAFQDGDMLPEAGSEMDNIGSRQLTGVEYFKLPHFAWLKFIRAELLCDPRLRFPVGYYYEDWPFHWELGFITSKIQRFPFVGYQYRLRGDSITGSGDQKLLYIFSAHRLLLKVAQRHSASLEVRQLLATKIHRGVWFVITNIQNEFLSEAVVTAQKHLSSTLQERRCTSPSLKLKVLLVALRLPEPFASTSISCIRAALNKLSASRRLRRDATSSY